MIRSLFAAILLALAAAPAGAGKFNKKLNVGDAAPTWDKLDATDGKKYAFADFKDKDVLVVVFTCKDRKSTRLNSSH